MGRASPGVRLSTLLMVVTFLALICAFEMGGRVTASKRRPMTRVPSLWRRARAMTTTPNEQGNILTNLLLGGDSPNKHPSQSRERSDEANSFLLLSEDEQSPTLSQFIDSDFQGGRLNSDDYRPKRQKQNLAFFDNQQTIRNLGRPGRRLMAMNWNPESKTSYLALEEKPYSSYRDAGQRPLLSFDARRIVVEPEDREAWKRPTQKYWRRFRSLDDRSKREYFLTSKRQPPPGFHAIRGKRESESHGAVQEDEEEGQSAINRWIHQMARRIRHK